jgi:hypothetical protein
VKSFNLCKVSMTDYKLIWMRKYQIPSVYVGNLSKHTWDQRIQAVRHIVILCLQFVSTLFYSYHTYIRNCIITEPKPSSNENKDEINNHRLPKTFSALYLQVGLGWRNGAEHVFWSLISTRFVPYLRL